MSASWTIDCARTVDRRDDAQLGRELPDELGQLASRLNQDAIVSLTTSRNCAAGDCQAIGGG